MTDATTLDKVLNGRLILAQPKAGHRVGHDAILLAAAAPDSARRMVDLGSGVGAAGLAFLARHPDANGILVELNPEAADLAAANVARNGLDDRCRVVRADVLGLARPSGPAEVPAGAADLVLMNPPFNAEGTHQTSPHGGRALAHAAEDGLLESWVKSAYRCLAPAGRLCLIHRPEALEAILAALSGRFGAVEMIPVHPSPAAAAVRLLVRAVKGRRTAPVLLPGLVLATREGSPTPVADAILRDGQGIS